MYLQVELACESLRLLVGQTLKGSSMNSIFSIVFLALVALLSASAIACFFYLSLVVFRVAAFLPLKAKPCEALPWPFFVIET